MALWLTNQGEDIELGDVTNGEKIMVSNMVVVAFCFIQMKLDDHPSMNKVLKMLETDIELLEMPLKPFYQLPLETSNWDSWFWESNWSWNWCWAP